MNANFGIVPSLGYRVKGGKTAKNEKLAERALALADQLAPGYMGRRQGVVFNKGDHARMAGKMQVHERLRFDETGKPMMYIFSNCKAFIRPIPLLMYDEHKPEDINTKQEDHVADECRYMCMANPMKPQRPVEKKVQVFDPLSSDENVTRDRYAFYRKY